MKSKLIFVAFITAFFSSAAFAGNATYKKEISKENITNLKARTLLLEKQVRSLQDQIDVVQTTDKYVNNLDYMVEMYAHGPAVVTSPALGVRRSADDASDLMVKLPSINEDLVLLKLRQKMDNYAIENHVPIPDRPIIALSGGVEGQIKDSYAYNRTDKTDFNLSWAELDVVGEAGPWATAMLTLSHDGTKLNNSTRVRNSRIRVDQGFVTVGQLNKFPLYFTLGQLYLPFGGYSSYGITDPSTKTLGRVKDQAAVLGFSWNGITAQAFGYPGETNGAATSKSNIFQHAGFNLGYEYSKDKFKVNIAGSIIGNLAESDGMQTNVYSASNTDRTIVGSETLNNRICGVDGRIKASYDMFTVLAEYVGATKKFNSNDLSFNGQGAKPQAFSAEGVVEFSIKGKPNNFSLGYGQTWQALALNLPKHNFFVEYGVSLVKNTILSFEYRHDINYGWNDVAKGNGTLPQVMVDGVGRHSNSIIGQLGIYF
ncbi:MAG: LbtU family siderophore porin [Gammaproteobacteria bacterium]|nr:LbtU family siderophore porin [Gammaproteobacteria bacterium]